jgi:hypothetical protein
MRLSRQPAHISRDSGIQGVNQRGETFREKVFGSPARPDEPVSGELLPPYIKGGESGIIAGHRAALGEF